MKFAIRQLIKSRGFTLVALITLALGIGANTTAFTVLNRLLLQSLPFEQPERLVQIWASTPQSPYNSQPPADFFEEQEHNTVFEKVAAYYTNNLASLAEPGQGAVRCVVMPVTSQFFPMVGIKPVLGRMFTDEDQVRHEPLALISTAYWIQHYQSDPQVLGKTVRIDNKAVTIIGVMPSSLDDPMIFNGSVIFWILDDITVNRNYRDGAWYNVAARLKPGVTLKQAQAEMTTLAATLAHDYPKSNAAHGLTVIPYPSDSAGDVGTHIVWLIMALSGGVLLIACVNLANLQLVRTTGRSQEISVRLALGCSRRELIGLLLKESIILSVAGGVLSLLIAQWSNAYIAKFLEVDMPLNLRVVAFGFATAAITGAIFGAVPAWLASRTDVNSSLKQGGRGGTSDRSRHRFRQALIVAELALALILLAGAGYFVRGLQRLSDRQLGWNPENVLVGYFSLDHDRYGEEGDVRSTAFSNQLGADLRALPGVEEMAFSNNSPVWGLRDDKFAIEGQPAPQPGHESFAAAERISPNFFKAYRIPLLQGRDFTEADRAGATNVAIVSSAMAKKYWPNENPIGKRIGDVDPANPNWSEIVGVVADITPAGDLRPAAAHEAVYRPWLQRSNRFMTFTLHTKQDPSTLEDSVRKVLAKLDSSVALTQLGPAKTMMASQMSGFSLVRRLLLQIGVLGLLLAAVGIYGVIANLAAERTKEIGIRVALGAQPKDIVSLFVMNGVRLAALGGILGLIGAFVLMNLLNKLLAIVPGNDPWVVITVFVVLFAVSVFACWLPAHRATKVDPMVALQP